VSTFYSPFFIRSHGMTVGEIGSWLAFVVAVGGLSGTFMGGALCDRYFGKTGDPRWYLWIPAITLIVNVPFGLLVYSLQPKYPALWMLIPYIALSAAYLAPSIASTHRLVGLRERALASALLLLILNLIGNGLGPMFTGFLSDVFNRYFVSEGMDKTQAVAEGLRWAIRVTVFINLWAALHYILGARTLRQDIATGQLQRA
jgi:hypothetical protein